MAEANTNITPAPDSSEQRTCKRCARTLSITRFKRNSNGKKSFTCKPCSANKANQPKPRDRIEFVANRTLNILTDDNCELLDVWLTGLIKQAANDINAARLLDKLNSGVITMEKLTKTTPAMTGQLPMVPTASSQTLPVQDSASALMLTQVTETQGEELDRS